MLKIYQEYKPDQFDWLWLAVTLSGGATEMRWAADGSALLQPAARVRCPDWDAFEA